jgi:hypothetical protein
MLSRSVSLARFEPTSGLDVIVSVQNSNLLAHYSSAKNTIVVCESATAASLGITCTPSLEAALRSLPVGTFVNDIVVRGAVRVSHLVLSSVLMQRPVIVRGTSDGAGPRGVLYCDASAATAASMRGIIEVCGTQQLTLKDVDIMGCPVDFVRALTARVVMRNVHVNASSATGSRSGAIVSVQDSSLVVDKSSFSSLELQPAIASSTHTSSGVVRGLDSIVFLLDSKFANLSSLNGSGAAVAVTTSVSYVLVIMSRRVFGCFRRVVHRVSAVTLSFERDTVL